MASADLPKEFDVVVLGTGMPESIVAAAFSRIGQSVLHLDRNDHYSGDWASFNLQGVENWAQRYQDGNGSCSESDLVRPVDESSLLEERETLIELPINNTNFCNAQVQYYVENIDEIDEESAKCIKQKESGDTEPSKEDKEELSDTKVTTEDKQKESCDTEPPTDCDKSGAIEQQEHTGDLTDASPSTSDEKLDGEPENNGEKHNKTKKDDDESVIEHQLQDLSTDDIEKKKQNPVNTDTLVENLQQTKPPKKRWTVTRLKAEWRKFNLDLSPKVLYSVGDMVELLISSDIAKYCEFKTITQVITLMNGNLERVPCSRADVFSSKKVSMLEKRMLMKFLQFCLQYESKPEEIGEFLDRPFNDFLTHKKLTPTIKHYIQHSIAMATDSMTTQEGLEKMKKFLKSLGRYGNTAFLWSLYGSGELPQSFCRMCAVFGGVYCLRMSASSMVMDSQNRCCAVVTTEGQKIKCKWLIMEGSYAPAHFICEETNSKMISRAIILVDRPLLATGEQEQLSLMNLPCPDDGDRPVTVLELPPSSMAAPLGVYVYHLTRKGKEKVLPKDDLDYAVTTLFSSEGNVDESKPSMLWSMFFTQKDMSEVKASSSIPDNVMLMAGPGTDIDIDRPVLEAKEIFKRILPDEEFLPKAPNPEDIIYVDDSEAQVADASSKSEFSEKDEPDTNSQQIKETDKLESSEPDTSLNEIEKTDKLESSELDTISKEVEKTDKLESSETDQSECCEQQSEEVDQSGCSGKESDQAKDSSQKAEESPKIEANPSQTSSKDEQEQEIS